MRLILSNALLLLSLLGPSAAFFNTQNPISSNRDKSSLHVSIGLGPEEIEEEKQLVPGVDYEVPDHEAYRTSRRSKLDEKCDKWFGALLAGEEDKGILGSLADDARKVLITPVPLINEIELPKDDPEWTPYVATKLPWTPLTPAFGLEEFGLPVPRRNAETWRHFDVAGMVEQDYSGTPEGNGLELEFTDEEVATTRANLQVKGGWLPDDECQARLVYINGRFAPQLSQTNDFVSNIGSADEVPEDMKSLLGRLTDGFTDELAAPVPVGDDDFWTSFKKLSGPNHNVGEAISQFAVNTQQGTACFAALNTRRTGAVAFVNIPEGHDKDEENKKPILIVNAVTSNGGASSDSRGVSFHPRCLVVAGEDSFSSLVQSCVDLDSDEAKVSTLYNGFTQVFLKKGAQMNHTFLEESGGIPVGGVEINDDDVEEGQEKPRDIEARRPELKDTHLEVIDVQAMGDDASYDGILLSVGGSGRIRIAHSVTLLRPGSHAGVKGFSLSAGAQQTDIKTNIHHIGQATTSEQLQKNMIGGRSTGSFKGRIRVEQSAQQTNSEQLARTVLLSDRSRAWAVPSLEIIADDVSCTHGCTVSDLSEEELFYLRARGLDRTLARNLLMYGFAGEICGLVDPSVLEAVGSEKGLQQRVIAKLENIVPQGERAIKGDFQSV
ncbi:unnamed protein product [Cylindrotheca closterium]|uniref:SUF system FeS cluster assembly SufBD core domain-containing protein n=1 Tax=Cylindrotheca closterium TaxID=2856 RepID=A0AAD2GA11_9STRA|nr:unnamed protein product [Cylindrotheca closterium]